MSYRRPVERRCDCRCPTHHRYERTTFNDDGCACTITCATQPMTLLAEQFNCALFLDFGGVWHVPALEPGHWDWRDAASVDADSELYPVSLTITDLLSRSGARPAQPHLPPALTKGHQPDAFLCAPAHFSLSGRKIT